MRRPLTTLAVVVTLSALAAATASARPLQFGPLGQRLAGALAVPHVSPARSAALAVDLATGEVVFRRNEALSLAPASNEKLPVTYAALVALGPSFRFETELLGDGVQEGTTWRGDLILKGYGDPTLSRGDLEQLARQVRAAGISRVSGAVVGDESFFDARRTGPGWKASFFLDESAPLSALVVERSRFHGYVSKAPALAAAFLMRDALRDAGVAVAGEPATGVASPDALSLASVASARLDRILRWMDRESDNFVAEMVLKQLGSLEADRGSTAAGARVVTQLLAADGVPLAGVRIADGSGLSLLDRLTVNALVAILRAAWDDPQLRPAFTASLPVAGVNGTLEDRMRRLPARGRVLAKTGTTQIASALSGYVRDRYVFAVIQNGHPVSSWWSRVAQDRFATVLAGA